jgi:hypothetical protein
MGNDRYRHKAGQLHGQWERRRLRGDHEAAVIKNWAAIGRVSDTSEEERRKADSRESDCDGRCEMEWISQLFGNKIERDYLHISPRTTNSQDSFGTCQLGGISVFVFRTAK